jgi:hypothetical protein
MKFFDFGIEIFGIFEKKSFQPIFLNNPLLKVVTLVKKYFLPK